MEEAIALNYMIESFGMNKDRRYSNKNLKGSK